MLRADLFDLAALLRHANGDAERAASNRRFISPNAPPRAPSPPPAPPLVDQTRADNGTADRNPNAPIGSSMDTRYHGARAANATYRHADR